jgi:hypothetical protein
MVGSRTVQISVRLYAGLNRFRPATAPPSTAFPWETVAGASVTLVAQQLGIPADLRWLCAVNGQTVDRGYLLQPGDALALVAASSGGSVANPR